MIFSTDICPICFKKLELTISESYDKKIIFIYKCSTLFKLKGNFYNCNSHYINTSYEDDSQSSIIIGILLFSNSKARKTTIIYDISGYHKNGKGTKILSKIDLIDVDFSQQDYIINRFKSLYMFP